MISNVAEAPGIGAARASSGLPTAVFSLSGRKREEHDADVVACLRAHGVDLVCLAGYMRLLSPQFVAAFPHRILNIHPSLLPAFPGLEAQEQAFDYGVKVAGCTVHFVDEELDHGAIIVQRAIPVLETDDEHSLAARILRGAHRLHRGHCPRGQRRVRDPRPEVREKAATVGINNQGARAPDRTSCLDRHALRVKPPPQSLSIDPARQRIGFVSLIHSFTPSLFLFKFADYFPQISILCLRWAQVATLANLIST